MHKQHGQQMDNMNNNNLFAIGLNMLFQLLIFNC